MPDASLADIHRTAASARTRQLALVALLTGALAIAFGPIFVRISDAGPTATAFWRVALAAPVLLIWLRVEQPGPATRPPSTRRDYLRLLVAGLFFSADLTVWHLSIRYTSVANSTLLANLTPMVVAPMAWLLFKERITRTFVFGMMTALAGAVILMSESLRVNPDNLFGDALGLTTAVLYAGYILSVGHLRGEFSTATIMVWTGVITSIVLLPVVLLLGEPLFPSTTEGWLAVFGLAMLSHVAGQSLITHSMAHLPTSFSSVSLLIQPAGAALLAWAFLAEPLGPLQALGAVVVMAGIMLARRGSR